MASIRKPKNSEEVRKEPYRKRPVGRPPLELPEPIPDTPENIARVVLNTNPKKPGEWRLGRLRAQKSGT